MSFIVRACDEGALLPLSVVVVIVVVVLATPPTTPIFAEFTADSGADFIVTRVRGYERVPSVQLKAREN